FPADWYKAKAHRAAIKLQGYWVILPVHFPMSGVHLRACLVTAEICLAGIELLHCHLQHFVPLAKFFRTRLYHRVQYALPLAWIDDAVVLIQTVWQHSTS